MKKIVFAVAAAALGCAAIELPLLERFDAATDTQGSLLNGASIVEDAGLEKGALKLTGDATANRIIYSASLPITGGNTYALAFNYKTGKLQNYTFRVDVLYNGVKAKPESYNMVANDLRWAQKQVVFTAPEGATSATLRMRLVKAPAGSTLLVDNLRLEQKSTDTPSKINLCEFATDFTEWSLDKYPVFDHFMPGPGASIVKDAAVAKSGDTCFKATGDATPMQYALYIDNICTEPNAKYSFDGAYKATDAFKATATGILIFFYKDATGKAIGQSRFPIRATAGEWKPIQHTLTAPENCAFVDIGLNMRNAANTEYILLDQLSFKKQ